MTNSLSRREFLKAAPGATLLGASLVTGAAAGLSTAGSSSAASSAVHLSPGESAALPPASFAVPRGGQHSSLATGRALLEPCDYRGVTLHAGPGLDQYLGAREFYHGIPDDDILHGYRIAAGLAAPGRTLGGWAEGNSNTVFGQWLSGMSRMYAATGDLAMRDKAIRLVEGYVAALDAGADLGMRHYGYDKMVCGLVDLEHYAGYDGARPLLERLTERAVKELDRSNHLADPSDPRGYYGRPQEWYTLSENLFRAHELTGDAAYRSFGEAWLYPAWWGKFDGTSAPPDAHGVHAYSHANSLSSCATAYGALGDESWLRMARNGYDWLQGTQCFATGGYGPNERMMAPGGSLGESLVTRNDHFETVCGSWAGFKLSRYLQMFTGEARYGDWLERLYYNGVGAALPVTTGGKNYYFSSYRLGVATKIYNWERFTCCSGTYIQAVTDYHNLLYYKDSQGLYVNLYVPSEVTWETPGGAVRLVQETTYPVGEETTLALSMDRPSEFALRFRVPSWCDGFSVAVNGSSVPVEARPGTWASVSRTWNPGDRVTVRIPMRPRYEAVDPQHPDRVAVVRGPSVLVQEAVYHDPQFILPPEGNDLADWLIEDAEAPGSWWVKPPDGRAVRQKFRPYHGIEEAFPFMMYFDLKAWPTRLW